MIKSLKNLDQVMKRLGASLVATPPGNYVRCYQLRSRRALVCQATKGLYGQVIAYQVQVECLTRDRTGERWNYCTASSTLLDLMYDMVGRRPEVSLNGTTRLVAKAYPLCTNRGFVSARFYIWDGDERRFATTGCRRESPALLSLLIDFLQGTIPVELVLDYLEDHCGLDRETLK